MPRAPWRWLPVVALGAWAAACAAAGGAGNTSEPESADAPAAVPPPSVDLPPAGAAGALEAEARRAPSPAAPYAGPAPQSEEDGVPIHGEVQLRYRGRRTDDAEQHDLYTTLALDVGDAERNPFTAHLMGRLWLDLGGDDPNDLFFGTEDRFGSPHGLLYYAYADAHRVDGFESIRLGRQQIWDTPVFVVFDGLRLEPKELGGLRLGAYGGLRTQYYDESTPDDLVGGVYGEGRPWEGGRLRVDYMRLEDEQRLGDASDDLLGLGLWQQLGEELALESEFTALEGRGRDLRLRAHYLEPESELMLQGTYYAMLQTQKEQALEVDPYFSSLAEYFPFQQVGLLASKAFGEHLSVDVGLDLRRLDDEDEVGEFNHEFERYYLSTVFPDLLLDGLELTLTADVWQDDQQDVRTWGADLRREFKRDLEAALGSYYSLYKYDLFLDSERDDVRTYYAKLRYGRGEAVTLDLGLDYEDDDFEEYLTPRVGVRWRF
jgi:hypothetical protein